MRDCEVVRRAARTTRVGSSAASDVYQGQEGDGRGVVVVAGAVVVVTGTAIRRKP